MRHPPDRNGVDGAIAIMALPARSGLALAGLGGVPRLSASLLVLLLRLLQVLVPGDPFGLIHRLLRSSRTLLLTNAFIRWCVQLLVV